MIEKLTYTLGNGLNSAQGAIGDGLNNAQESIGDGLGGAQNAMYDISWDDFSQYLRNAKDLFESDFAPRYRELLDKYDGDAFKADEHMADTLGPLDFYNYFQISALLGVEGMEAIATSYSEPAANERAPSYAGPPTREMAPQYSQPAQAAATA